MIPCARHCLLYALFIFAALGDLSTFAGGGERVHPFAIDDYFKLRHISDVALSSDGKMVAYAVESQSLDENRKIRSVCISATTPGATAVVIDKIQDARNFAWIPGSHELAYVSDDDNGIAQIYSIDPATHEIRNYTSGRAAVLSFSFASDGETLAWLTRTQETQLRSEMLPDYYRSTLYDRLFFGEKGVVIDSENTVVYQFVNPDWPDFTTRPSSTLWVKRENSQPYRLKLPGDVRRYYWSSDAAKLSITYVSDSLPKGVGANRYTSVGVFNIATKKFEIIRRARPDSTKGAVYFFGGQWVPNEDKLFVFRTIEGDTRTDHSAWTLLSLERHANPSTWHAIDLYHKDAVPAFLPENEHSVFSNRTYRAHRSLYKVNTSGLKLADMARDIDGSVSSVRFSVDFQTAALVIENFHSPEELYIWRNGHSPAKLTHLNDDIVSKGLPTYRELNWQSKDGETVYGWLLEPPDYENSSKPWPMISYVHGGPASVVTNEFAGNFHLWPYPVESYALNGIAVFIPNYRGSTTFGNEFLDPKAIDGEPVEDIVTGIAKVIDEGIADRNRLGISGHSHGAWLASLVMTRESIFRAGSFAEGTQNSILMYNMMPAWVNRKHDRAWGGSLYDKPQRYINTSPDLHFNGLHTAVLFEAGAKSLAVAMLGSPKAALRAGMPTEFIVYPQTSHNIRRPGLQKESATRNLDWFRFWLQNYEDPDPEKAEQYARWRNMRDEQCERLKGDNSPSYCRQ